MFLLIYHKHRKTREQILCEFDVLFYSKLEKSNWSCLVRKHILAGALYIHWQQQFIGCLQNDVQVNLRRLDKTSYFAIQVKLKLIKFYYFSVVIESKHMAWVVIESKHVALEGNCVKFCQMVLYPDISSQCYFAMLRKNSKSSFKAFVYIKSSRT